MTALVLIQQENCSFVQLPGCLSPTDIDIMTCCNQKNNLEQNYNTFIISPNKGNVAVSFYSNPVTGNQQNIAVQTRVISGQHILVQSPDHRVHL